MRNRYLVAVALALALSVPGAARAQGEKKAAGGPRPSIEIPEMNHDIGKVFERDKYDHSFLVRNRGNGDLVIEDVKPG